ncbi:OadG family protein [Psychrilyobacter sp.]|uniref:OadG family protein n=1 Tax=Psychrilyobacter sp. TaxID=2586924 RepID=UPI00301930EA
MTINEIMVIFKNPETIQTLSTGDKFLAVGFTVVLGMGITFVSLVALKCVIDIMAKVLVEKEKKPEIKISEKKEVEEVIPDNNDEDVVAAIVIALATKLAANKNKKIVIRNIKRVNNEHSPWGQLGIVEQINNRL